MEEGTSSYSIPIEAAGRLAKLREQLETEFIICGLCWTMYGTSIRPADCRICSDERNLGPRKSHRRWYTHSELRSFSYRVIIEEVERDLFAITVQPINQRCFFILNPMGNLLWGCTSYVDESTEEFIRSQGGIRAIAVSHPHELYSYARWAVMFNSPVYIHARDKDLIVYNSEFIETWSGEEFAVCTQFKLIRLGGHFDGGAVLHWTNNGRSQDGKGVIFCADMLQIGADDQTVGIMRSYSNFIPLSEADADRILWKLACFEFERIYASGNNKDLLANAKVLTIMSLEKYAECVHIPKDEEEDIQIFARVHRPPSPAGKSLDELGQPFEVGSYRYLTRDRHDNQTDSQISASSSPTDDLCLFSDPECSLSTPRHVSRKLFFPPVSSSIDSFMFHRPAAPKFYLFGCPIYSELSLFHQPN